ncbi:MAG: tRNA (adenosine(37)-N6)-threonylcarbamoyltransferase complex dimerization subunit type 1 TsaB [Deltaproteobacteria bacterium]|nr:tRNA (adenosine(37)-N6)-threonylcarbamoyltransferase complex dimerization subunit type 1 TsaB [Deltaproteobacteria bacterium]
MRILALDTSGASQSVALLEDERCLRENFEARPSSHSETLIASIQNALDALGWRLADLDLLAVSAGPGSFTGLRIGISTVKGLARVLEKPVVGVSTLLALVRPHLASGRTVVACLDARCGEVYAGAYTGSPEAPEEVLADRAWPIEAFLQHLGKIPGETWLLGDALSAYPGRFAGLGRMMEGGEGARVSAAEVGRLAFCQFREGKEEEGGRLQVRYLRVSEAENRRFKQKE